MQLDRVLALYRAQNWWLDRTAQQIAAVLVSTHGLDAAATISRLSQILARHTGDWASDDTALLALRVPPRP